MRITLCVDALEPQPGGIGRYTWELCKGLVRRSEISKLEFYGRNSLIADPSVLLSPGYVPPRRPRWSLRALRARRLQAALHSDLVHGPNYFLPAGAETGVVTIHDLSVFRFPETHPAARVRAFERLFSHSLERACHVITDTETIRQELIETFSVRPETVTAVALGVSDRFRPLSDEAGLEAVRAWDLKPHTYGLCISTLEPRKKILELLSVWRRLPEALRREFPLVLAGGPGWENEAIHNAIETGVAEGWLRHLGFVEEAMLPALYAGAALFVYPSSYEGFGLPPLEAMASGVPVIVSNRSCLPEVCGTAARYIDPDDEDDFASAVRDSLEDAEWRSRAARMGLERASEFSWDRCVNETLAVYRKVINPL